MSNEVMRELPRYRSHKEVRALQIKAIEFSSGQGAIIYPADNRFAAFHVPEEYVTKHEPKAGGYYVVYEDGYRSWSPAEAFEGGYTLIS